MSDQFLLYEDLEEEELSAEELAAIDAELAEEFDEITGALAEIVEPPPDLAERVSGRIKDKINRSEVVFAFADLFGVGLDTFRHLSDPGEAPNP